MNEAVTGRHRRRGTMEAARAAGQRGADQSGSPAPPAAGAGRDRQLVSDLYREHGLDLVRVALLLVGDKETAEDVVQDAFVGLFRGLHRLADTDKALAYLRVSVINGCRSVHRKRRGAPVRHTSEPTVWSAESAVMAREDSRLALQAVAQLPPRAREVLALRYYLDMADQEIAATLQVSRGTVSSTASRALTSLAQALREQL